MVKDFKIILNQPLQQGFLPGAEVSGILAFEITQPKSYSYVQISLLGRAKVFWSKTSGSGQHQRTSHYSANREYVNMQAVVWSQEQAHNGMLDAGSYNFPFQFVLPNQRLPRSFGSGTGSIRYGLEGRIGTGILRFDHVIEAEFPLLEVVDTNDPQFEAPVRGAVTKTICCWCCASGPITLTAETSGFGFCSGEVIPLNVHLENGSNRQISVSASIHQRVVYTANGRKTYDRRKVFSLVSGPMQPRTPSVWSPGDELKTPLVEPTLTSCDIIQVTYFLRVLTLIPRAYSSAVDIPITIGNVPRQDANQAGASDSLLLIDIRSVAAPVAYSPYQGPTASGPQESTPYCPQGPTAYSPQKGATPSDSTLTSNFPQRPTSFSPQEELTEPFIGCTDQEPLLPGTELSGEPQPYNAEIEESTKF